MGQHGILHLHETGLHVDPVREAIELPGSDMTGYLEAIAEDLHGLEDPIQSVLTPEPAIVDRRNWPAERSPDRVETRAAGTRRRSRSDRVVEPDGEAVGRGARAEARRIVALP